MRRLKWAVSLICALFVFAWAYRIISRKYYVWLPGYAYWLTHSEEGPRGPVHLFFLYADHFEPGRNFNLVARWQREYPQLADRHRDSAGRPVQHTWFYPAEQEIDGNLDALRVLAASGYGETELHLHHSHDTQESAQRRFQQAIAYFQKFGFLKSLDGQTHFAFIHGNWGLDNSLGEAFCGNSRELRMLKELGCFADFTFPSLWRNSQPSWVNGIEEVTDNDSPKSYDHGVPVSAGWRPAGDLVLLQGPLLMVPTSNPAKLFVRIEDGDIHPSVPLTRGRVDAWVRANIHVGRRPDWVFIKAHGHAASSLDDLEETLGPRFENALSYLETRYNDGEHYVLHYVTAREAYNLIRAAADGKQGDPRQYFDYVIPRYAADGPREVRNLQSSR
ncbi:MAG: hypothetical protein C5B51_27585 [Terriglobia bacterium]|nr:MAG: hypothetical protein C5B51_27585 [Terriglobia bacterium]